MSDYIVSARKYRPDSFGTLIGQDNIARTLKNSILRGQLAHAYLFCGPRGVGKTTTARIFAKMINCSNPSDDMEPCGQCESCISFAEGRSYCIHELDAASNNGVEDIKNLMDQVRIPPQVGKYSVYIIDEVHMLSQAAFNAFLKTLEEPPAHAIFILATTEKHKILPTILSRCQTYDFNRITVDNIVRNLRMVASSENITIDDESLHVIAHKADGAMRDALTIFDQTVAFCGTDVKYQDVLRNLNVLDYEYSFSLVDAFLSGDYPKALLTFDEILTKGFNALHFVAALSSHLRDLIVSKGGGMEALLELPESLKARYREQASRCSLPFLYEALDTTTKCEAGYRASVNPRLHIEFALMRLSFIASNALKAQPAVPSGQPSAAQPAQTAQPAQPAQPVMQSQPTAQHVMQPQPAAAQSAQPIQPAAAQTASAQPVQAAAAQPAQPEEQQRERRARASRSGAATISMKAVMDSPAAESKPAEGNATDAIPSDDEIRMLWQRLADTYSDKPRLFSMLKSAELEIEEKEDGKTITFRVMNQAQKDWVESKLLHDLEGRFRKLALCVRLFLRVSLAPDDPQAPRQAYMPGEQAKELISNNEQVKNLVQDLGLDIK